MPLTQVKYLPKSFISPSWIEIFKDCVAIAIIKGWEAKIILIQDAQIAKNYLNYFHVLWKSAKK